MRQGELPALPKSFTRPVMTLQPTSEPEQKWLDPQLQGDSAVYEIGSAGGNSSDTSTVLVSKDVDNADRISGYEENTEGEIGAWSL